MKKTLHLRRALRTVLLVLLLSVVGMEKGYAQFYDFSAVCSSGQMLYYKITDAARHEVALVRPCGECYEGWGSYGFAPPVGNVVLPEMINSYTVTSIGEAAFASCTGLTSVTIPESIVEIGESAFSGTGWLMAQPDGILYLDGWCLGYKNSEPSGDLNIAEGTKGICDYAFINSFGLDGEIVIPNSVEIIGSHAFAYCENVRRIVIGNSVKVIHESAFARLGKITTVTIPNSVIYLSGFNECTNLTSVIIPNSVETIGSLAFSECTNLTSVTMSESVTTIGKSAFRNCSALTMITIPASVCTVVGSYESTNTSSPFKGCTNLRTVYYNARNCNELCYVNHWGDTFNWLQGCPSLTTVYIGKEVQKIPEKAFCNLESLTTIYYNVERNLNAPTNVFDNSPNLTTIHIGPDVKQIGSNIFKGCNTVHFMVALGPTPAVLDVGAFSDIVDNSMLMVSCGNKVTYFSVWNMFPFNNIIEDCNTYSIESGVVGSGGNVTVSASNAQMGEEVQLTVTPNPGMHLTSLIVCNTNDPTQIIPVNLVGKATSTYSFTMPPFGVVVMATFATGTSVGEIDNSIPVVVYPNPTTGNVRIEASNLRHVSIFNVLGQQVYEGSADGDVFEYDMNSHEAGIYLVRIETTSGIVTKRVVLTK